MKGNLLSVEGLTVVFKSKKGDEHRAVNNFSLTLAPGEAVAVVGESGSGKTTMMRAVMRVIEKKSGSVELFGSDTESVTPAELRALRHRCGYIPQDPYGAVPPGLSVLSAVLEPVRIAGLSVTEEEAEKRAVKLLASLGLTGERILSSRAVSLSGGQRQRVEIARALMLSPELLLCDEPTSMQDASTRGEIIDVLKAHVAKGAALLFITHDLLLAGHVADRIIVMKNGKICEHGESSEVLKNPKHEYTKKLLASVPVL